MNLALDSVLGEKERVKERNHRLASFPVYKTLETSVTVCHRVSRLFFSRPSENCKWKGIQKNLD